MLAQAEALMQIPDIDLVARCRVGDRESMQAIYEAYAPDVQRYAYRLLGDRDEAADAVQETFLRAFSAIGRFRGECSLRTWIFRICTNLCRDLSRKRRHRREEPFDSQAAEAYLESHIDAQDPLQATMRSEMVRAVRLALRSLPMHQRELIVLRDYERIPMEEIAAISGCSVATVRVKLYRAHARLRERVQSLLKEEGNGRE